MLMDQGLFSGADCAFHRLQLLRHLGAWLVGFQHSNDIAQMTIGSLKPRDEGSAAWVMV
jgi:hypothetical protein